MVSIISDLINLKNSFLQCFTLPKPLIFYIFKSSNITSSQKLMKSCKIFKILHLKFGKSLLKELSISQRSHKFDIESACIKCGSWELEAEHGINSLVPTLNFEVKVLKVIDELNLSGFHEDKFSMLMMKLDLSLTRKIMIGFTFNIQPTFMEILLQPELEKLTLWIPSQDFFDNFLLFVFQRCPNLKEIDILYPEEEKELLTEKDFKEIVQTKNIPKIKDGKFGTVTNICPNDLIKFMNKFVEENGEVLLAFKEFQHYLALKNYLENFAEEKKQRGIAPWAKIGLDCQNGNEWFDTMV